ncbi:MAG TPA: hypothetical protein VIP77_22670 [Jiangellaceae bacterium]
MTVMATTATQQPLNVRVDKLIRKAMNRHLSTTSLGRALKDAINEVAANLQVEARDKGWERHEIQGIRHFTLKTGAAVAFDLVAAGYMTADEFRAA